MTRRRRIIVSVAASADGFIARPDGSVEWLDRPRPPEGYGMADFMRSIDTVIWGRKTYDFALCALGERAFDAGVRNVVFSRRPPSDPPPNVEFVTEPVAEFACRLRQMPGKDVWIMGGAGIIASFLDTGEIDEFILKVVPTFIGDGIPLASPRHRTVPLTLVETRGFPDGVVRLHYALQRPAPPGA